MINDLAIYGAGGLGREMALLVDQVNAAERTWNLIGYFDDGLTGEADGLPVLGGLDRLNRFGHRLSVVIAIADGGIRERIVKGVTNPFIDYPVIKHPTCLPGGVRNYFGRGTILTAGCILTTGIVTGEFVLINLATTVGHDARLGSYSSVMPGARVSGNVTVGERALIGTGAMILQSLSIGAGARVGAGAVVTHDVTENQTVVGVPARAI